MLAHARTRHRLFGDVSPRFGFLQRPRRWQHENAVPRQNSLSTRQEPHRVPKLMFSRQGVGKQLLDALDVCLFCARQLQPRSPLSSISSNNARDGPLRRGECRRNWGAGCAGTSTRISQFGVRGGQRTMYCTAPSPARLSSRRRHPLVPGTAVMAGTCSEVAGSARSASGHRAAGTRCLRRAPRRPCEHSDSSQVLIKINSESHSDSDQTGGLQPSCVTNRRVAALITPSGR